MKMKLSTFLSLAIWSQIVPMANANEILCIVMGFIANLAAPMLKTMLFEQVKDDLTIGLPMGGNLLINEPGDPTFDGCSFSMDMQMGIDSNIIDFDNAGVFTLEGTLRPASILQGNMCIDNVQVTDYMIQDLPLSLDSILDGRMPAVDVTEEACMSMVDTAQFAFNVLLGLSDEPQGRRLRGIENEVVA